jgi:hypothetical protein
MARTYKDLREAVAAFMHRDPQAFASRGSDLLANAINNARLYAERLIDFEFCKTQVVISCSTTVGGDIADAKLLVDNTTPIRVKKVGRCFLAFSDGSGYFTIDMITYDHWINITRSRNDSVKPTDPADWSQITDAPPSFVQYGSTFFIAPSDPKWLGGTTFNVYLDCWRWLDDYDDDLQTDFLLQNCFDWLMYRSIYELNFFLKEDERVQLSEKLMSDSWSAIIRWNSNIIEQATSDVNLD